MSEEKPVKKSESSQKKLAVIRIRGITGIEKGIKDTLSMLCLYHNNYCVVVNDSLLGMIKKVKDYVTWGEIDDETYKLLVEKRGEEYKGRITDTKKKINYKKFIIINNKKYKKYFRLSPPRGGFERKGIKVPFTKNGALGYRKEKINDLIKKMV
jgi:large subunit ribosomal protein L30